MQALLLILSLVSPLWPNGSIASDWTAYPLIAHGMGEVGGRTLTNSGDAFLANYRKGFRVFEVDLRMTSDGRLVALHDWGAFLYGARGQGKPDPDDARPIPWAEFKSMRVDREYRPLDMVDIAQLLAVYPDAFVVTDTKSTSPRHVRRQFRAIAEAAEGMPMLHVADRIVPQIYNREMYGELESIYSFSSYIYTLYQSADTDEEVIRFVAQAQKIKAVTMSEDRVSQALVSGLKKLGVKTYVHTVNDPDRFEAYRRQGIDGVYTDRLDPSSVN